MADQRLHVLERLAATNPYCEIWFDSSPLVYETWKKNVLEKAPAEKRAAWPEQLTRLFNAADAALATATEFAGATRKMVDFVARVLEQRVAIAA